MAHNFIEKIYTFIFILYMTNTISVNLVIELERTSNNYQVLAPKEENSDI